MNKLNLKAAANRTGLQLKKARYYYKSYKVFILDCNNKLNISIEQKNENSIKAYTKLINVYSDKVLILNDLIINLTSIRESNIANI